MVRRAPAARLPRAPAAMADAAQLLAGSQPRYATVATALAAEILEGRRPVGALLPTEQELCQAFGVIKQKNMYGKQVRGIERSTFLIDAYGVLVQEWRGVKVPGHAKEVLQAAKSIG